MSHTSKGADLFDAGAEQAALASGRNVNQERIELVHGAPSVRHRHDTPDGSFDDHPAFWDDVDEQDVREVEFAVVFIPPSLVS